jgi:hypothetical protein
MALLRALKEFINKTGCHLLLDPKRIGLINDPKRIIAYLRFLKLEEYFALRPVVVLPFSRCLTSFILINRSAFSLN